MTKTNHELARAAAEKLWEESQLRGTEAFAAKIIEDAYAEAMAERDEMRDLIEEILAYCGEPLYRHRPKWAEAMKRVEKIRQTQPQPPEATT